jgi:hypothetical protein
MKSSHALGFILVGVFFTFIPSLVPAWFPPNEIDGSNASELWLGFMGWVQITIGAIRFGHSLLGVLATALEYDPAQAAARAAAPIPTGAFAHGEAIMASSEPELLEFAQEFVADRGAA